LLHNPLLSLFHRINLWTGVNCSLQNNKRLDVNANPIDGLHKTVCIACEIQTLFETTFIGDSIQSKHHSIFSRIAEFTPINCTRPKTLVPANLLYAVWMHANHMAGYEQQDAHEFLIAILDGIGKHQDLFHGKPHQVKSVSCSDRENNTISPTNEAIPGQESNKDKQKYIFKGIINEVLIL